jgi:hypothetical protein
MIEMLIRLRIIIICIHTADMDELDRCNEKVLQSRIVHIDTDATL